MIEDVITTGGAVRDATLATRAQGARGAVAVSAVDRNDTVAGQLDAAAIWTVDPQ